MIADSDLIDVVDLVIKLFSEAIGREEDRVITAGSGVGQPSGYALGTHGIQTVACAGNLDFDDIINLIYLLPKKYNARAKMFVNRNNIREMRKIKDTDGRYLWQDPLSAGQPATIHGFPVVEDNNLPESEIYFGDMKYAYILMRLLIEKLTANAVNCWNTLKNLWVKFRAISSEAREVIFGNVQRLVISPIGAVI